MTEFLYFNFLNVGKGNCTIIDFASKRLSIIDIDDSRAISSSERILMESEGIAKLTDPNDYILNNSNFMGRNIFRFILTHPDMDHISGIKKLFENKNIINFWDTANKKKFDPDDWEDSPYNKEDWDFYQEIRKSNEDPKSLNIYRDAKSECCWTQDGIRVLSPTQELIDEANENEDYDRLSYVLMIEYAGKKILLTGDTTKEVLKDIIDYYGDDFMISDVLFAPNHGSSNHISEEILDTILPNLTVVSVARGVDYDRELYSQYGKVLSTKYYGNIWIAVNNLGEIYYQTEFRDYKGNWHLLSD